MELSAPGHSSTMRRAGTMYGQRCRVGGRGGVGPLRFGGASLCWGRSMTFHSHQSVGISQVRWVHLARQYIALSRSSLRLRMAISVSRNLCSRVAQMWGFVRLVLPAVRVGARVVRGGGGVVYGEE